MGLSDWTALNCHAPRPWGGARPLKAIESFFFKNMKLVGLDDQLDIEQVVIGIQAAVQYFFDFFQPRVKRVFVYEQALQCSGGIAAGEHVFYQRFLQFRKSVQCM